MSWIQKLFETYENCQSMIGVVSNEKEIPLLPICHTTQKANIEIVIDGHGNFKRANVLSKIESRTIIPCTEGSAGRTTNIKAHALCDKLQYVAKDYSSYGGRKRQGFERNGNEKIKVDEVYYINQLLGWCSSDYKHPKVMAIFNYIKKGNIIKDLIEYKVLVADKNGKLLEKWDKTRKNDVPEIFSVISDQSEAFIRWIVEVANDPCAKTWVDHTLWSSWIEYYSSIKKNRDLCYVSGNEQSIADQHPKKIRNDGDGAKLISSNDISGFTFRGRFLNAEQACGVGFEITQKAHNALRWLISRQGYRRNEHTIVAWATSGANIPQPINDPVSLLEVAAIDSDESHIAYTAQDFALRLKQKIAGYSRFLGETTNIVVMGLDSATPGRLAITYYRELTGSDFLHRIEKWHDTCAWTHDYRHIDISDAAGIKKNKKYIRFIGAPAPQDVAEAAYGNRIDDKLRKSIVERILPCIIDGQNIPRDIVESAVFRASNRVGMEPWEWNKTISIACALFRKLYEKEDYKMALEEDRKTRDYLYGRLLAIADSLEQWALNKGGENRQTNAARLMNRFADHPYSTWLNIEKALNPYRARLGNQSSKRYGLISQVISMFEHDDFTSDRKLTGEFLLGYHCQREALWKREKDEQVDGGK